MDQVMNEERKNCSKKDGAWMEGKKKMEEKVGREK